MRGRGALLLALCCLGAGLAAAQDGFCAGAMPAGTAEPGFWEQLPEDAELPAEVRNATLEAFQLERWVQCAEEDLTLALDGCHLAQREGGELWELRLNLTCTGEQFTDAAWLQALVEAPEEGPVQANITSVLLELDPARQAQEPAPLTVDEGGALFGGAGGFGAGPGAPCGAGQYLHPDGYCTDCTRYGCADCRRCQPGDPWGSCQDNQFCLAPCRWGFFTNNNGACLPCANNCQDCRACQGEPGCANGFCNVCQDGLRLTPSGACVAQPTCPQGCTGCNPNNNNACTGCQTGWFLNIGRCVKCTDIPALQFCARCEACNLGERTQKWCHGGQKCMGCIAGAVPMGDGTQRCRR